MHAKHEGYIVHFLEAGSDKASMLDFDYNRTPQVCEPNAIAPLQKMTFKKARRHLVPTGVL